jgi:hypothetical protein
MEAERAREREVQERNDDKSSDTQKLITESPKQQFMILTANELLYAVRILYDRWTYA